MLRVLGGWVVVLDSGRPRAIERCRHGSGDSCNHAEQFGKQTRARLVKGRHVVEGQHDDLSGAGGLLVEGGDGEDLAGLEHDEVLAAGSFRGDVAARAVVVRRDVISILDEFVWQP